MNSLAIKIYKSFYILLLILLVLNCNREKKTNNQDVKITNKEGVEYILDTTSKINWSGYKIEKSLQISHFGYLKFKSANIFIKDKNITGGEVIVDMNSINNQDLEDLSQRNKLITHLKDKDFFDTAKYPTSTFEIISYKPLSEGDFNSEIIGNITIKGVKKEITIKTNIEISDSLVEIRSERFPLSRKEFGIDYSGVGNILLEDNFDLQIECITHKK